MVKICRSVGRPSFGMPVCLPFGRWVNGLVLGGLVGWLVGWLVCGCVGGCVCGCVGVWVGVCVGCVCVCGGGGGWGGVWVCGWGEWMGGWVALISRRTSFPRSLDCCLFTVSFNSVSSLDAHSGTVQCVANVSDSVACTHQWVKSDDGHAIQDGATLDLSAPHVKPGEYQCIADCVINEQHCRVLAKKVHYTTLEDLQKSKQAFLKKIFFSVWYKIEFSYSW